MASRKVRRLASMVVVLLVAMGVGAVGWGQFSRVSLPDDRAGTVPAVSPPMSPKSTSVESNVTQLAASVTPAQERPRFTAPAVSAFHPALADFVAQDAEGQADRVETLTALTQLDDELREALIGILAQRGHDAYVRNQIANLLTRDEIDLGDLVPVLVTAIADEQEPPLWRDYALQHLGNVTLRCENEAIRAQGVATVTACFHGDVLTLPGTALIALLRWQDQGFRPLSSEDIDRAHALAASGTADTDNRITAIAALADHRLPDARPRLRELLEGETEPILLATIAAALGRCGTSDDNSLLARFADHDSALVSGHVTAAMRRLAQTPSLSTPSTEVIP